MRNEATAVGVTFGDAAALEVDAQAGDVATSAMPHRGATRSKRCWPPKIPKLVTTLQMLLGDPALRDAALSGLAMYDDPHTPANDSGDVFVIVGQRKARRRSQRSRRARRTASNCLRPCQKNKFPRPICRPT